MFIPNHFRQDDRYKLLAFMRENSFAILVTLHAGAPFATHLPLVIEADEDKVVLKGHLAKANPQWQGFSGTQVSSETPPLPASPQGGEGSETHLLGNQRAGAGSALEALVIFHGPHAYISPANYESRQSVPTWNYIAVHAYGVPRIVETKEAMLDAMIAQYEPAHLEQWHEQTEKFKAGMLAGIVAFEIDVMRLQGKYKLSQNRPEDDRRRIVESLSQSDDPTISGIASHMRTEQP
jgi:transcriptional regulator